MNNLAGAIVVGFFAVVFLAFALVECDSCTDKNCPKGTSALMVRGNGMYKCVCVVRPGVSK
jgi:hypothetical protein